MTMFESIKIYFQVVFNWVTICQLLAVSFSLVWVMSHAKKDFYGIPRIIAETVAVFATETAINLGLFCLSYYFRQLAGINFPLAHLVTIAGYTCFYLRRNPKSRLIIAATMFITAINIAELGTAAKDYFNSLNNGSGFDWVCIVAYAMIVEFAFVINKYSVRKFVDIPRISVWFVLIDTLVSTAFVIGTILIALPYRMSASDGISQMRAALCLGYLLIYINGVLMYLIIYVHSKEYVERVTVEVENSLLKANANMMTVSDQAMEEVREIRHDIGNQYAVIKIMLKEKKYDELEKYFDSMNIEFEDVIRFVDCGNTLVNSVINMEILKAQSYGTRIVSLINVPSEIDMDPNDLSRILVNLIDNSIEAMERDVVENKMIEVNISLKNDYLYIVVRNEVGKNQQKSLDTRKLNTTKDDYRNHGYGHKIVRRIVNRYSGEINYSVENGEFIVDIMLDLKKKPE